MSDVAFNVIAGSVSGIIECISTHPLDLIKTKIQNSYLNNSNIQGNIMSYICNDIYKKDNVFGFYRGITPRLIGIIPLRITYWSVINKTNHILCDKNDSSYMKFTKLTASGIFGGFVQTLIDNPIEVFKVKMMTSDAKTLDVIKGIVKSKPRFPGLKVTMYRNIPFTVSTNVCVFWNNDTTLINQFLYGALGGFIGSIITQPIDYYKTQLQRHCIKEININWKEIIRKNPAILWSGGLFRVILNITNMGIGSVCFNQVYQYLSQKD